MGFMILMKINHLPALSDYWKLDPTYRYGPIADRITRDQFFRISHYLHFIDNTTLLPRSDPGYKLGKSQTCDQYSVTAIPAKLQPT